MSTWIPHNMNRPYTVQQKQKACLVQLICAYSMQCNNSDWTYLGDRTSKNFFVLLLRNVLLSIVRFQWQFHLFHYPFLSIQFFQELKVTRKIIMIKKKKHLIKWKDELWKTFCHVITSILCFSRNVKILLRAPVSKRTVSCSHVSDEQFSVTYLC